MKYIHMVSGYLKSITVISERDRGKEREKEREEEKKE